MLFIHGCLSIGGIETFYVRMAKERHKKGLKTSILLQKPKEKSNPSLINECSKYAKIYYLDDFFVNIPIVTEKFPLLAPIKKDDINRAFQDVDQIHVYGAMYALLGQRLLESLDKNIPITIGFYHYIHYIWGKNKVAYNVRKDREFVFNHLPKECLLFFSEGNKDFHTKHIGLDFSSSHVFRLGVVDKQKVNINGSLREPINITTVGRLVNFKTYNFFMLDVLKVLINKGYKVNFNIYGDGPLYDQINDKIRDLSLSSFVILHGKLEYDDFNEIVSKADLFIGSGTAIIQAASLGVPSIIGIENISMPKTYGYFSEVYQYEYNIKDLDLPLIDITDLIIDYIEMNEKSRSGLKMQHINSIGDFTNESCQISMNNLKLVKPPSSKFKFNRWMYEASRVIDLVHKKINKNHPYNIMFRDY